MGRILQLFCNTIFVLELLLVFIVNAVQLRLYQWTHYNEMYKYQRNISEKKNAITVHYM